MELDPFAQIADEEPADGSAARTVLLGSAKRGFCPLRKEFVQRARAHKSRPSVLGAMVNAREELALRALLLIHALEPILPDNDLPLGTWARMLAADRRPCSPSQASAAFNRLVARGLIDRTDVGRRVLIAPRMETGSGEPFVRSTAKGASVGPGYLTIPHEFWTTGLADRLRLPGTAMFLVALHETTQDPAYQVSLKQMQEWYGISERTAERGYLELSKGNLLLTHTQSKKSVKSPTGLQTVTWRALDGPYSTAARAALQTRTKAAVSSVASNAAGRS
ncbi:MAG: hypothetical protein WCF04_01695 [Candidatus Nanopelagicales bacterium]